jgi:hypothetical protein
MTRRLAALGSSRIFRLHVSPHPVFDRMRFLFTMSDIERLAGARLPSTFSKRQAPRKRNLFKSHRKDRAPPPHVLNRCQDLTVKTLVEPDGIEPTTSCLQSTRSPN